MLTKCFATALLPHTTAPVEYATAPFRYADAGKDVEGGLNQPVVTS